MRRPMSAEKRRQRMYGYGLVGVGFLFLLAALLGVSVWTILWPFFIILPGAFLLYIAMQSRWLAWVAFPASIVTGTGVMMLVMSITDHFEAWAYAWTLYGAFLGLAFQFVDRQTNAGGSLDAVGRMFVRAALIAFLGFGAFFEILIFNAGSPVVALGVPLLLIASGLYMLSRTGDMRLGHVWERLNYQLARLGFNEQPTPFREKAKRKNEELPGAVFVVPEESYVKPKSPEVQPVLTPDDALLIKVSEQLRLKSERLSQNIDAFLDDEPNKKGNGTVRP